MRRDTVRASRRSRILKPRIIAGDVDGKMPTLKLWNLPAIRGSLPKVGKGFLTGAISDKTEFDKTDFRNTVPRFAAE
ncbi:MAG: hypothetical protein JWP44_4398, partial [Mucilaginibacter sp.]|nr:hypothetical protein [Mucilaginibacter sp.]